MQSTTALHAVEQQMTQTIWATELELDGISSWDWAFTKQEALNIAKKDFSVCADAPNFLAFAFHRLEVPAGLDRDQIQAYLEDEGLLFDRTDIQLN
jgi:hypothetical protein